MVFKKTAPFLGNSENFPDANNVTVDFKSWLYTFLCMTINFPVLSPVCYIFQFKDVAFCLNIGKSVIFAGSGPIFSLVSISRGLGEHKYFDRLHIYNWFIYPQIIKVVQDLALY